MGNNTVTKNTKLIFQQNTNCMPCKAFWEWLFYSTNIVVPKHCWYWNFAYWLFTTTKTTRNMNSIPQIFPILWPLPLQRVRSWCARLVDYSFYEIGHKIFSPDLVNPPSSDIPLLSSVSPSLSSLGALSLLPSLWMWIYAVINIAKISPYERCRNLLSIDSWLNRIDPSTDIIFSPNAEQGYRTKFQILLEGVFQYSIE